MLFKIPNSSEKFSVTNNLSTYAGYVSWFCLFQQLFPNKVRPSNLFRTKNAMKFVESILESPLKIRQLETLMPVSLTPKN